MGRESQSRRGQRQADRPRLPSIGGRQQLIVIRNHPPVGGVGELEIAPPVGGHSKVRPSRAAILRSKETVEAERPSVVRVNGRQPSERIPLDQLDFPCPL